jgi:reverse gyrase
MVCTRCGGKIKGKKYKRFKKRIYCADCVKRGEELITAVLTFKAEKGDEKKTVH